MGDAFRNDLEAAHRRVSQLEGENTALQDKIGELERAGSKFAPTPKLSMRFVLPLAVIGILVAGTWVFALMPGGKREVTSPKAADPHWIAPTTPLRWGAVEGPGEHVYGLVSTPRGRPWLLGRRGRVFTSDVFSRSFGKENTGVDADLYAGTFLDDAKNPRRFLAAGERGVIVRRAADGRWTPEVSGTSVDLHAACGAEGALFVVGERGTILHDAGHGWQAEDSHVTTDLFAVAAIGERVVAVGAEGVVLERVGGQWQKRLVPTRENLRAVYANQRLNEFWIAGDKGTLLVEEAGRWFGKSVPTTDDFCGIVPYVVERIVLVTVHGEAWVLNQDWAWMKVTKDSVLGIANAGVGLLVVTRKGGAFEGSL